MVIKSTYSYNFRFIKYNKLDINKTKFINKCFKNIIKGKINIY